MSWEQSVTHVSGLDPVEDGAPRGIRTPDMRIRRPPLYPTELWARACIITGLRGGVDQAAAAEMARRKLPAKLRPHCSS